MSKEPRIFHIENLLSDAEAEHLVRLAVPHVARSQVGSTGLPGDASYSPVRTSRNTWLPRAASAATEHIWRRFGDVLGVDEKALTPRSNAEDLQVVHYLPGQKYDAHHDWGTDDDGDASRVLTLLLYLNDVEAGGQTAFPRAKRSDDYDDGADALPEEGLLLRPRKGSAALFYNLLEDGNPDNLTLHAALPVIKGEKWLANLWVWDPVLPGYLRSSPDSSAYAGGGSETEE